MHNLIRGCIVGCFIVTINLADAYGVDTLWTKTYGGTSWDKGYSIQECASGGFIIAGQTYSFGVGYGDVYLVRINANGDTLWAKTYGGVSKDAGYSVQECADSGFIVTGAFGAGKDNVYLIRTNVDGDTLWTKTYGGTDYDRGESVEKCASGGFIIAGRTKSFGVGSDSDNLYLIRVNADGDTLWTKAYGGTDDDWGESIQECVDSGFIITGATYSFGAGGGDVWLVRTDANGDTLWTKAYGGIPHDRGMSVQKCADSGFIIAGITWSFGAGYYDIYLLRTDADGDTLWTKTYGGTGYDEGYSVQECASGGFVIAGRTSSFGAGNDDVYLIRTNVDGDTLWTKTYGGTSDDGGYSVQECVGGGFVIAGVTESFGAGGYDVYLIRTNDAGVEEERFFADAQNDRLRVYPNPCGKKIVVRYSSNKNQDNLKGNDSRLTIYDISGKLVKTVLAIKQDVEVNLEELNKGVYFVRVETGDFTETKKIILMR